VIDEQAWLAAWDEPDLEAIKAFSADDLEVTAVTASIEPRHYKGRDAAVQWLVELRERLRADWSATSLARVGGGDDDDDDDAIVVEGELRFVDTGTTGAETQTFAVLMRLRDDKVRWIGTFVTRDAALEAHALGVGS
jgi:ketosteroid isomerase-like protein